MKSIEIKDENSIDDNEISSNEKSITETKIFDDKSIADLLTIIYKKIEKSDEQIKNEYDSAIKKEPGNISFLLVNKIKNLQTNNEQLYKIATLAKDILFGDKNEENLLFLSSDEKRLIDMSSLSDNNKNTQSLLEEANNTQNLLLPSNDNNSIEDFDDLKIFNEKEFKVIEKNIEFDLEEDNG